MRLNKKAIGYQTFLLTLMALAMVGILVGGTWYFGFRETTTTVSDSNAGDQGTLKLSSESVTEDPKVQFAGTGYCWATDDSTTLIESRNGKTLSATAGTTFAPAYRGTTYECTAFSATHYCDHESGLMINEGLELRTKCKNISNGLTIQFYEDDTLESTVSMTVSASETETYNKFSVELAAAEVAFPLGAICIGTNASDSNIADIEIKNWARATIPQSTNSTNDDYCFTHDVVELESYNPHIFLDSILVEADDTGITPDELLTLEFMDMGEYVADDGSVKYDYFARETSAEADVGATNCITQITLTS